MKFAPTSCGKEILKKRNFEFHLRLTKKIMKNAKVYVSFEGRNLHHRS